MEKEKVIDVEKETDLTEEVEATEAIEEVVEVETTNEETEVEAVEEVAETEEVVEVETTDKGTEVEAVEEVAETEEVAEVETADEETEEVEEVTEVETTDEETEEVEEVTEVETTDEVAEEITETEEVVSKVEPEPKQQYLEGFCYGEGVVPSVFENAVPIWDKDLSFATDRVLFRKKFTLEKIQRKSMLYIASSGSYSVYVNSKLVVSGGGIAKQGSKLYYDAFAIGKLLRKGVNMIVVFCNHNSAGGYVKKDVEAKYFVFACPEIDIYSSKDTQCYRSNAYTNLKEEFVSATSASSVTYDASVGQDLSHILSPTSESNIFIKSYELAPQFAASEDIEVLVNPLPSYVVSKRPIKIKKLVKKRLIETTTYVYKMPKVGKYSINLKLMAKNGCESVFIRTDNFECDHVNPLDVRSFKNESITYICKGGMQVFDAPINLIGQNIIITAPNTVKIKKLIAKSVSYDYKNLAKLKLSGSNIAHDDIVLNSYIEKAIATFDVCMGETIFAAADRERAFDSAACSMAVGGMMYGFDKNALQLVKLTIQNFMDSAISGRFQSFPMGNMAYEAPFNNLIAFSSRGFIASYCYQTGDYEFMAKYVGAIADYLMTFNIDGSGFVSPSGGDSDFIDHYRNIDSQVLYNAVYYSACKTLIGIVTKSGAQVDCIGELLERANLIKKEFSGSFRKTYGYSGTYANDERANAWALITGLADSDMGDELVSTLSSVQSCSPAFENYVLDSLMAKGKFELALRRFVNRFHTMTFNESMALDEGFFARGSKCYSGSSSSLYSFYRYIAGVAVEPDSITITPNLIAVPNVEFACVVDGVRIAGSYKTKVTKKGTFKEIIIDAGALKRPASIVIDPALIGKAVEGNVITFTKGRKKFVF